MSDIFLNKARTIIEQNTRYVDNDKNRPYTVPTDGLYPWAWSWDSFKTAEGVILYDEPKAWKIAHTYFESQHDDGMLPHIAFFNHSRDTEYFPGPDVWGANKTNPPTSGIPQPPVAGSCVKNMLTNAKDKDAAKKEAAKLFDKILKQHRWFHQYRDMDNTGLVSTYHIWATGRDDAPAFKKAMSRIKYRPELPEYIGKKRRDTKVVKKEGRPTNEQYAEFIGIVEFMKENKYNPQKLYNEAPMRINDVGTNAILLRANKDLLDVAKILGRDDAIPELSRYITQTEKAFQKLWNPKDGFFQSFDKVDNSLIPVSDSAGFLALYAGAATKEQAEKIRQTFNEWSEGKEFGVPSLDPKNPDYNPERYWRGPSWAIVNDMIADGFKKYGFHKEAAKVMEATKKGIEKGDFYECHNPETGKGLNGPRFSWTASMYLKTTDELSRQKDHQITNNVINLKKEQRTV